MTKHRGHGDGSVYFRESDQRFVASLTLPGGKRKYIYAKDEKEAKRKLRQAQLQLEQGTLVTAPQQSLHAFLEQWLHLKRTELKDGTYVYYRVYIQSYIIPALGPTKLHKLSPEALQTFYADLQREVSPNTVRLIHAILKSALTLAVKWKKMASNPCHDVTPPRAVKKEIQVLTLEQAQQLLEAVRHHPLGCLLTLALATGMRRGELLALHWSDIDLHKGIVQVKRTLTYHNPDGTGHRFQEEEPKTRSSKRSIPLPVFALDALHEHRRQQVVTRLKTPEWEHHDLVFCNKRGGYFWLSSLQQQFKRLLKELGLPDMRFHDLRHSAATLLLMMGVSPKLIQERLGHSNITITLGIYSHVTASMQEQATQLLDAHFHQALKG